MSHNFYTQNNIQIDTQSKITTLGEELITAHGIDLRFAAYAILVMRLSMGFLFLAHACLKLFVFKMDGTVVFFESLGLPGFMAYVAIIMEVIGGAMLIGGMYVRLVAIILSLDLWGAVFMVHGKAGFWFTNQGGGWEYPVFWILMLYALALLGSGAYSYDAFQEQDNLTRKMKDTSNSNTMVDNDKAVVSSGIMNSAAIGMGIGMANVTDADEFNTLLEVTENEYLERKKQRQTYSGNVRHQSDSVYDEKMVYQYHPFWFIE
jgi:putative oxidoreductase